MADTIFEDCEELVAYGVPRPVVFAFAARFIEYGAASAVYRRETREAIAEHAAQVAGAKWPSGRLKPIGGCGNG